MIKYGRQSALLVAITSTFYLWGCSTGIQLPEPSKQDLPATSAGNDSAQTLLARSTLAPKDERHIEAEGFAEITDEMAVFFTQGSADLSHSARQKLEIIAERLAADRALHVVLLGYANDNGSSSFNLAVSDNRAATVAGFLRKHGVHGEQIRAQALGSEKPQ